MSKGNFKMLVRNMRKEKELNNLLEEIKENDPQFELKQEFGRLLMIPISDFTEGQRLRYLELREQLHSDIN